MGRISSSDCCQRRRTDRVRNKQVAAKTTANTVLYVKAKITANDGTNLGADAAVGPANLSAQSVFASGHVSPKLKGGYTAGGNLPLGDLMGKEEPAQGSSNGLRTIHDLA